MRYLRGHRWRFAVAAVAVAMGAYLSVTPPPGAMRPRTAAQIRTDQRLDKVAPALEYDGVSVSSMLDSIERDARVTIRLDRDAMRADGLNLSNLVVTASLRDIRYRRALEMALNDADKQLHFYVAPDGDIVLTTPSGQAKRVITRTYDVADLVESVSPEQRRTYMRDIVQLVTETVEPESWYDAGGKVGTITSSDSFLTIRNSPEAMALVNSLMVELRKGREVTRLLTWVRKEEP